MVCKYPFDIHLISGVLGIPYGKFYRWFKECLTEFKSPKAQEELHEYDFEVYINGKYKTILVPLFRSEHIGEHMAIDEKHINGQFYTVLSNAKTGKVALLCSTIKSKELKICLDKFGVLLKTVSYVSLDLSPTFELVAEQNFENAVQIADKFHVIKNGIEAVQAVRIRLKQEELKSQREEQALHEKAYRESKDARLIGPKMNVSKGFKAKKLENGETAPELLARSRYLCAISSDKWNEYQKNRAMLLFKRYPCLKQAYESVLEFREWYKAKSSDFEPFRNEKELGNWIDNAEENPTIEIKNFRNLVINHEQRILNYHRHGHKTNAIAESVNAKIQRAIRNNNGARDLDFFHFRIAMII